MQCLSYIIVSTASVMVYPGRYRVSVLQGDSVAGGPKLSSNAEHRQMQVTGRVQYIAGGSMLFSVVAGMCI